MTEPYDDSSSAQAVGLRLAEMSEVDLMLAVAETGALIEACVSLQDGCADEADWLIDACADLAGIEDELMSRGFSHRLFSV